MTASTDPPLNLSISVPRGTKVQKLIQVQTNGSVVAFATGTKAKMQIRSRPGSTILLGELSTENGGLVVDEALAQVSIVMSTDVTAAFAFERAQYDLNLIYPDQEWERILEGKIVVFPGITQPS